MSTSSPDPIDRGRFPIDVWGLTETHYDTDNLGQRETVFAAANGYLGLRGNYEEGDADAHAHGCFLNGFHETWPIKHAENAYGFARVGQTIVNVPDTKTISLTVDRETLHLASASLESFGRSLDFRDGILRRELVWRTASGKLVTVSSSRMVSFTRRNVAVMTYDVTVDAEASIMVSSEVRNHQDVRPDLAKGEDFDPRKAAEFASRVLLPQGHEAVGSRLSFGYRTADSRLGLAVVADHSLSEPAVLGSDIDADLGWLTFQVDAKAGQTITLEKWVAYGDCRPEGDVDELVRAAVADVAAARSAGVAAVQAEQKAWLAEYWARSDVEVAGQPELQQAIRWCLFQLAQVAGRTDGGGMAAKGVSGSGYEGHYFWDTEVYLVPFLSHTNPELARDAVRFRIAMLDMARKRAREMSQRGALFPWRTIMGEEGSAYYPAGTAQYHIDADVAFALCKYADVNADPGFLRGEALPVLVETARLFTDLGFFRGAERGFHIHGVTGPDEYSAVVNNNVYTNVMARMNLQRAAEVVRSVAADDPDAYAKLASELGLQESEIAAWEEAAASMTIP
ncbi:MAG TPA: glycoside hydrolase family 65 protein, partial [Propionibacteriaceae bacterium]|nr:glycoside hydrolase family 65 protein [Propionibacteriaceae bacterium]